MSKDPLRLPRLWIALNEIKQSIDNVAVPLGANLGIEDPELMISLEDLSDKIEVLPRFWCL